MDVAIVNLKTFRTKLPNLYTLQIKGKCTILILWINVVKDRLFVAVVITICMSLAVNIAEVNLTDKTSIWNIHKCENRSTAKRS